MSQNNGEPAWQGKTYEALKDKKHLTGINKRGKWGPSMKNPIFMCACYVIGDILFKRWDLCFYNPAIALFTKALVNGIL